MAERSEPCGCDESQRLRAERASAVDKLTDTRARLNALGAGVRSIAIELANATPEDDHYDARGFGVRLLKILEGY